MKKIVLLFLAATLILTACSKDQQEKKQDKTKANNQPTFTEEDIKLAKDIIDYTHQLEKEFVQKANQKLEKTRKAYRKPNGVWDSLTTDSKIAEDMQEMAKNMIVDPLVGKYGDLIVKDVELKADVNVGKFKWKGNDNRKIIDEYRIYLSYEDFQYHGSSIKYYKKYDIHELVFEVNEKKTKIFDRDTLTYEFTFYKSKDGKLIIGDLAPLKSNVYVSDFTDDKKYIKDDLNKLPPLQ